MKLELKYQAGLKYQLNGTFSISLKVIVNQPSFPRIPPQSLQLVVLLTMQGSTLMCTAHSIPATALQSVPTRLMLLKYANLSLIGCSSELRRCFLQRTLLIFP